MSVQPSTSSEIDFAGLGNIVSVPAKLRWWSGCRVIGLMSVGLWAGVYQIVLHIF